MSLVLFELRLEAFEQRESVGGRAGEAGQYAIVIDATDLARGRLHDDIAQRDLTVAAQRYARASAYRENGGPVKELHDDCRRARTTRADAGATALSSRSAAARCR